MRALHALVADKFYEDISLIGINAHHPPRASYLADLLRIYRTMPLLSPSQRAHRFAAFMTMLWISFSIGANYSAHIATVMGKSPGILPYLIGGTFAVWFLSFFGYLSIAIAKREEEPA